MFVTVVGFTDDCHVIYLLTYKYVVLSCSLSFLTWWPCRVLYLLRGPNSFTCACFQTWHTKINKYKFLSVLIRRNCLPVNNQWPEMETIPDPCPTNLTLHRTPLEDSKPWQDIELDPTYQQSTRHTHTHTYTNTPVQHVKNTCDINTYKKKSIFFSHRRVTWMLTEIFSIVPDRWRKEKSRVWNKEEQEIRKRRVRTGRLKENVYGEGLVMGEN